MAVSLEFALIFNAVDRATRVIGGVTNALEGSNRAAEGMKGWGQTAMAQGAMISAVSGKIQDALGSVVAPAQAVEDALAKVSTVVTPLEGSLTDAMGRIKTAGLDWSKSHTDSAAKFIDTTYNMISAGLDERASVEATRVAMLVAKATMGDAGAAANVLGTLYNNLGDEISQVGDKTKDSAFVLGRLGDIVTATQQTFQFENLGQFTEGLKMAFPLTKQYGLGLDEVSASLGLLNNAGLVGSMAGTSMTSMFAQMSNASQKLGFDIARTADGSVDFATTLEALRSRVDELGGMTAVGDELTDAFGQEGVKAVTALLDKTDDLRAGIAKVGNATDAAAQAALKMESTGSARWQIITNRVDALKVSIGDKLGPSIERLLPQVEAVLNRFGEWMDKNPELVTMAVQFAAIAGAVLAVVGPVVMAAGAFSMFGGHALGLASTTGRLAMAGWKLIPALGGAAASAWTFTAALLANPITWIVLAIVAAAALIYVFWDPIVAFFVGIWDDIKAGFQAGFIVGIINVLKYFSPVYWFYRAFSAVVTYLSGLEWSEIGSRIWNSLMSVFSTAWGAVSGWVSQAFQSASDYLGSVSWSQVGTQIVETLLAGLAFMAGGWVLWLAGEADAVTSFFLGFSLFDSGAALLNTLTAGIRSRAGAVVDSVKGVVQDVRNLLPFSPAKEGPLRDLDRIRLVETIAESVRPAPLTRALTGVASAAAMAVPTALAAQPFTIDTPAELAFSTMPVQPRFTTMPVHQQQAPFTEDQSGLASALDLISTALAAQPITIDAPPGLAFSTMPVQESAPPSWWPLSTESAAAPLSSIADLPQPAPDVPPRFTIDFGSPRPADRDEGSRLPRFDFGGQPPGGAAAQPIQVHIHLEAAGADESVVEQLERWVRGDGGPKLHAAVRREAARQGRKGFGA